MHAVATDYTVFANAYLLLSRNWLGETVRMRHLPAINMRRMKEPDRYGLLLPSGQFHEFGPGEVLHLKNYDVSQTIYGLPGYLGAIQSMLLNEDATLFRRRYYKSGAHVGYIFYSSSAQLEPVSYTHLDVYKRQAMIRSLLACMASMSETAERGSVKATPSTRASSIASSTAADQEAIPPPSGS